MALMKDIADFGKWLKAQLALTASAIPRAAPSARGTQLAEQMRRVPAGYELALTTKPYYHSTFLLLIAKGRGWDDISKPRQLEDLPLSRQGSLKIAMLDRGPGTALIQAMGLLEQGVPYQTMTGDDQSNLPMQIEKDLKGGKIDMAILWGPMAGYVLSQSPKDTYKVIKMVSRPGIKFDFSIAMAVRYGDKERLSTLNRLIDENRQAIREIMMSYQVPLFYQTLQTTNS